MVPFHPNLDAKGATKVCFDDKLYAVIRHLFSVGRLIFLQLERLL